MTEVVLYHHIQGLTEGVRSFADALRQAGHIVHTPDLFDGRTFATMDEAFAVVREAGDALDAKANRAAQALPETDGAMYPFWSSDSRFVGFFAQKKLKKIQLSGGLPQTLCDAPQPPP